MFKRISTRALEPLKQEVHLNHSAIMLKMTNRLHCNFPGIETGSLEEHLGNCHGVRVDTIAPLDSSLSSPVKDRLSSPEGKKSILNVNARVNLNDLHVSLINSFMAHSKSLLKPSMVSQSKEGS